MAHAARRTPARSSFALGARGSRRPRWATGPPPYRSGRTRRRRRRGGAPARSARATATRRTANRRGVVDRLRAARRPSVERRARSNEPRARPPRSPSPRRGSPAQRGATAPPTLAAASPSTDTAWPEFRNGAAAGYRRARARPRRASSPATCDRVQVSSPLERPRTRTPRLDGPGLPVRRARPRAPRASAAAGHARFARQRRPSSPPRGSANPDASRGRTSRPQASSRARALVATVVPRRLAEARTRRSVLASRNRRARSARASRRGSPIAAGAVGARAAGARRGARGHAAGGPRTAAGAEAAHVTAAAASPSKAADGPRSRARRRARRPAGADRGRRRAGAPDRREAAPGGGIGEASRTRSVFVADTGGRRGEPPHAGQDAASRAAARRAEGNMINARGHRARAARAAASAKMFGQATTRASRASQPSRTRAWRGAARPDSAPAEGRGAPGCASGERLRPARVACVRPPRRSSRLAGATRRSRRRAMEDLSGARGGRGEAIAHLASGGNSAGAPHVGGSAIRGPARATAAATLREMRRTLRPPESQRTTARLSLARDDPRDARTCAGGVAAVGAVVRAAGRAARARDC